MRLAGRVAQTGEKRDAYNFLDENPKERDDSEDLDVDGKIILEWILEK
jgi:hypothetical protein